MDAAQVFVNRRFPECSVAFLAGSVIRGERTSTSDLARRLQVALVSFCQAGVKDDLIKFAEEALDSVGGRLFEGYSSGKRGA